MSLKFELSYVQGVEGNSIYLNDYRIAGPKPWGGGKVLKSWVVDSETIERALRLNSGTLDQAESLLEKYELKAREQREL